VYAASEDSITYSLLRGQIVHTVVFLLRIHVSVR